MKASKKVLSIVVVAVMAIALLCVNGCKKEKEAQPTTTTPVSAQR